MFTSICARSDHPYGAFCDATVIRQREASGADRCGSPDPSRACPRHRAFDGLLTDSCHDHSRRSWQDRPAEPRSVDRGALTVLRPFIGRHAAGTEVPAAHVVLAQMHDQVHSHERMRDARGGVCYEAL
jgi:hypothetical protein